jgi:sialate O-acetylesterase
VGGTPDEAWSSTDALEQCLEPNGHWPVQKTNYSFLWNSMIAPLTNTTIKGAVWYQGEADAAHPGGMYDGYNCTFPAMIQDWRLKWGEGTNKQTDAEFPFGFVQLNSVGNSTVYDRPSDKSNGDPYSPAFGYGGVRWAQTAGFGYTPNPKMPNVFMATSFDTPGSGAII